MAGMHHSTRGNREAGQALFLTAISLVVLVGMLGLGIDMGVLRYEKRLQQTAADAAAIAGASDLQYDNGAGVSSAAQSASATNDFTDSGTGDCGASAAVGTVCVQVNSAGTTGGPLTGPHAGDPNYVEVLVSAVHPTYFARIFGKTKATVTARAVATNVAGGPNKPCLLSLSALVVNGTINVSLCSIIVNGDIQINGQITGASSIGVAGRCSGSCSGVVTGIPAVGDPLANLSTPPANGCQPTGGLLGLLLNFCNGNLGANLTLSDPSGLYVVPGGNGLSLGAGVALQAPTETLYVPNGITLGANSSVAANAMIVGKPLNVGVDVSLNLGGSGNSPVKSAVLVE